MLYGLQPSALVEVTPISRERHMNSGIDSIHYSAFPECTHDSISHSDAT